MKIRSKTDIITNSSSETYIMPTQGKDYYFDVIINDFQDILEDQISIFSWDFMIYILERGFDVSLVDNPFPVTKWTEYPWCNAKYYDPRWTNDIDELWKDEDNTLSIDLYGNIKVKVYKYTTTIREV